MAKDPTPPALSELERTAMDQVWAADHEVSVREVLDGINASSSKERAYTTVMTIMSRLQAKTMVSKRRESKSDLFSPTVSKAEYLEARAKIELDALVGEYGEIARALFVREIDDADPSDIEKLRRLANPQD